MITVQVLYADGTPVVGATVNITWSYFGAAIVSAIGASGPTSAKGSTNSNGYVYLGASIGGNTPVDGTVTSSGGDLADFNLVTDANGNGSAVVTTTWQPLASLSNTISTIGASVGSFFTEIVILGIVGVVLYIVYKKFVGGNPLNRAKALFNRVTGY